MRPPGHHAEVDESCGFCYFNNISIAAKYAQRKHGIDKVLVLDWDIHHGNGIQNIFYDDPSVLYMSLHRFDNGDYFPCQKDGSHTYVGKGAGKIIIIQASHYFLPPSFVVHKCIKGILLGHLKLLVNNCFLIYINGPHFF